MKFTGKLVGHAIKTNFVSFKFVRSSCESYFQRYQRKKQCHSTKTKFSIDTYSFFCKLRNATLYRNEFSFDKLRHRKVRKTSAVTNSYSNSLSGQRRSGRLFVTTCRWENVMGRSCVRYFWCNFHTFFPSISLIPEQFSKCVFFYYEYDISYSSTGSKREELHFIANKKVGWQRAQRAMWYRMSINKYARCKITKIIIFTFENITNQID